MEKLLKLTRFQDITLEILNNFKYMLSLKENGLNLFFTDIDSIKSQLLKELQ